MQVIKLETEIAAPVDRCFLLSLNVDLHRASTKSEEEVISGVKGGLIGPGQTVTFQARHFGVWLTHKSIISVYHRPKHFQDRMVRGMFRFFEHDHFFEATPQGTLMRDVLRFSAPLGLLGRVAERLALRRHLDRFLRQRNSFIKTVAESADERWKAYLSA